MTSTCAYCGGPSVFRVDVAGDQARLCRSCLDKRYPELMLGTLAEALVMRKVSNGVCPNCGWTEAQLNNTGMLGCPLCYEAFSEDVWPRFGIERNESGWAKAK